MADRPILFSGPMVRALLDGRKTQTRRVLSNTRFASIFNGEWADSYVLDPGNASWRQQEVRYAAGDRLYVREAWRTVGSAGQMDRVSPRGLGPQIVWYEADGAAPAEEFAGKFRQAMHMPRWASRLTLTVTDVRVQCLQEISEADAIAEGIEPTGMPVDQWKNYLPSRFIGPGFLSATNSFLSLWDSLNADRGYGWDTNPWVVAVTFTVDRRNIDEVAP